VRYVTLRFGLLWVLLSLGATAHADPLLDDADWLRTMAFAAHETNYSGVFVYQAGGRVETSRITHVVDAHGVHERLQGLDGQRREIIRNNDQVWLHMGDKRVRFEKQRTRRAFPALLPEQIQTLKENYIISQQEEDRVADYHAHTLLLQPRDSLRYTRKMWAESQSGLLLKAVVLDEHGKIIEQYAFTQLQIGGNIDRKWEIPEEHDLEDMARRKHLSRLPESNLENISSGWQVDAVPPGFKKVLEMRRKMRDKKFPVVHIVYSDGLAALSVFIEQASDAAGFRPGLTSQGAVHVHSRLQGDHLVTVVGEMPPRAVIQVADSVRYAGAAP
jgi:sigma-E factor negative regulatory protein RseB